MGLGLLALFAAGVGLGMLVQYRLQIGVARAGAEAASRPLLQLARDFAGEGGPSGPAPPLEHWRYPGATEHGSGRGPSLAIKGQTVKPAWSTSSWPRLTTTRRSLLITAPRLGLEPEAISGTPTRRVRNTAFSSPLRTGKIRAPPARPVQYACYACADVRLVQRGRLHHSS